MGTTNLRSKESNFDCISKKTQKGKRSSMLTMQRLLLLPLLPNDTASLTAFLERS